MSGKIKELNVKDSKYVDHLQYTFSTEELADKARIMSEQSTLKNELEDRKKAVVSDFKAQIDKCDADLNMAAKHYRDGWMMKSVDCIKRMNYDNGMVEFIRTDTGEIYKCRPMEGEELNLPLPTGSNDSLGNCEICGKPVYENEPHNSDTEGVVWHKSCEQ